MYSLGASFNFYLIHGGTNFGFWNGAEYSGPVRFYVGELIIVCLIKLSDFI